MISAPSNTRDAIIEAAADLFIANGFHGTSMRQIAHRAGVALGGIYNHFAGKEELFTHVILERHPINQLLPLLSQAEGKTAEALLRDGTRRIAAAVRREKSLLHLFFIEQVEFKGQHLPQIIETLLPHGLAFAQKLLQAPTGLKPYPPLLIIRSFFGLIFSHLVFELVLENTPIADQLGSPEEMLDIFLHGVLEASQEE